MTDLHDLLRQRTSAAHRALDALLVRQGLLDSAAGYRQFLEGWHRLQSGVETLLEASGVTSILADWPQRRRAHLLARDLAAMGVSPPPSPGFGAALSVSGVLGTAYVVEGATLGASVLLPRFSRLGIVDGGNGAFLSASAQARSGLWPAFLATLREQSARVDGDSLGDAAEQAFAWARDCFLIRAAKAKPAPPRASREPRHTTTS